MDEKILDLGEARWELPESYKEIITPKDSFYFIRKFTFLIMGHALEQSRNYG